MTWTFWADSSGYYLHRLASGVIAFEAIIILGMMLLTWFYRRDLIQSRAAVGSVALLVLSVALDRTFATIGNPLGLTGIGSVAFFGAVALISAAKYHTTLKNIPTPADIQKARMEAHEEAIKALLLSNALTAMSGRLGEADKRLEDNQRELCVLRGYYSDEREQ